MPEGSAARGDEAIVLREDKDKVATLTLNRPDALNALSSGLIGALQEQLDAVAEDRSVHCVVIAGAGKAFSPGHDLKELRANPSTKFYKDLMAQCSRMMVTVQRIPQPVIAKVQGAAYAAGCQLVASCDLAVAVDTATFCTPGVNIGLFCHTPMVAVSRNLPRKKVMEMLLTGDAIDAAAAEELGLINKAVPAAQLDAAVGEMAQKIASKSPFTVRIGKQAFYRQLEMNVDEAYAYAGEVMVQNMMARDAEEGIDAFIEKRTPVWEGR